ncbi:hypothetical protein R1flu_016195 [Riccia fluitans]|uniref:Tubulin epsilon chain n=1 Tax=Riccia fluitans TaxID=41844 RepID=A0ABD1YPA5_9MARC
MPRECITIQAGQCGNQVGCKFWESALREHAAAAGNQGAFFDDALSSFFRNVDTRYKPPREIQPGGGNTPIMCLKARAVLVDMEEGVVNQLLKGQLSDLFDKKQYITDNSGSGNNWAQGHEFYGPKYTESILEKIRHEAESCESLQSFFMLHSLGGGTGSGVGTYILELLDDIYPKVYRFCASVFPSAEDDHVVTSPYNSLLSTAKLAEHAHCVLPVENQALIDIIRKRESLDARAEAGQRLPSSITSRGIQGKPFDQMNGITANLLLHLTSSMRFEGPLNVDLNEITTNLVPYPRLHFLVSSMAPLSTSGRLVQRPQAINQIFTEVFSRDNQHIKASPSNYTYLACAFLMRGNFCTISDLNQNISRIQQRLHMVHWNTEGFKIGLCNQPPLDSPLSLLCLANNTCIGSRFASMKESFSKLYKRKVYVHHYTQYMDAGVFEDSCCQVDDLIAEYAALEVLRPPDTVHRFRSVLADII